jgi:hypothetical protein
MEKNNLPLLKGVLEEMVSSNTILDTWRSEGGDELARRFVRSQRYIDFLCSNMDEMCKSDRQICTARIRSDIISISTNLIEIGLLPHVKRHISSNSARKALNFYSSDTDVTISRVQGPIVAFTQCLIFLNKRMKR